MKGGYLIEDTRTGAMDGRYKHRRLAEDALARMRKSYPGGRWVIRHSEQCPPIPESRFWVNALGAKP